MIAEVFTDAAGRRFESSSKGWRPIDEVLEEAESRFDSNGEGRREEQVAGNGQRSATIRASEIVARNVEWLWRDRVPLGMTSVFAGFPGVGKSTILYDLSARISREGRAVLIATAEDHLAHVVRPRLEAADADLDLVHVVDADITLPDGIGELRKIVTELDVALVILDPLVAFISEKVNSHRDHHVRRVLAPLAELAEETKAAIMVVIHTNKGSDTEPLMRISGSIGFTGAARSVLLAADDPQDDNRRILGVVKSNLAEMPAPLAYRVVGEVVDDGIPTSRIEWLGEAPEVDVRELLAQRDPEERTAREEAIEYLQEAGVQEIARQARELLADAGAMGISDKTLQRARRALRIPSWRDGFQGPYYWGPRPGPNADLQPGHTHPVHIVQVGTDQEKHGSDTPNLDTSTRVGEQPLTKAEAEAIELLKRELGAMEVRGEDE
jgi:hypothetical protein